MRVTEAAVDTSLRDRLVLEYAPLVKTLARRLARRLPSTVDVDDLMSIGMVGLIEAAGRYRPTLGVPFDAFARRRVHGAMLDALRDLDWAPRSMRRRQRDIDAAIAALQQRLGREPSEEEVAREMGVALEQLRGALDEIRTLELGAARALEGGADATSLIEFCVDPGEDVVARIERSQLVEHLGRALDRLPARERQILSLYYEHELTLAEIGQVIGVGESRVSQLRALAISRLRAHMRRVLGLEEDAR
jgi:RNA polymerase sigma factor for flagellar operon FliA